MTPELKSHIQNICDTFYRQAKESWDGHAVNRKPVDHVYKSILYLRDQVRVNRNFPWYSLECAGEHEIHFLNNAMNDLKDSLSLSPDQLQWTGDLFNKILIHCLHEHPRTTEQKALRKDIDTNPGMAITLEDGKRAILARIRNMLLTQNI